MVECGFLTLSKKFPRYGNLFNGVIFAEALLQLILLLIKLLLKRMLVVKNGCTRFFFIRKFVRGLGLKLS